MNSILVSPLSRLVILGAFALGVGGCVAGSGNYQTPSTPYKGSKPWDISSRDAPVPARSGATS